MFQAYRSNDAVITIRQDNERRAIDIRELNDSAQEVLGYPAETVAGRALSELLPARIRTLLDEYVEFDQDGNDVGTVLGKVQSFCVVDNGGKEHAFRLKVLRSESLDRHLYFRLILQNKASVRKDEAFRAALRDNFKGHEILDADTGLPDRNSIAKDLELVVYYAHKEALRACLAIFDLDGAKDIIRKHGKEVGHGIIKHIAMLAKQNLRLDDTIGTLAEGRVAILLMDTNLESARMVLNRLRWLVAANPYFLPDKSTLPITVSIGFAPIGDISNKTLLADSERFMDHLPQGGGNALVQITE
jgi:diguanylate cyclase (GGDEF)-like protein